MFVLDFQGSNRLNYLDVTSGKDYFTVCTRILGVQRSYYEEPLVIFQNPNGNYPISGIPDNIDGIVRLQKAG